MDWLIEVAEMTFLVGFGSSWVRLGRVWEDLGEAQQRLTTVFVVLYLTPTEGSGNHLQHDNCFFFSPAAPIFSRPLLV